MRSTSKTSIFIRAVVRAIPFTAIAYFLFVLFTPGHFSGDTADAYLTAAGAWQFADWHSPMLGVIWRELLSLWQQPQVLLLLYVSCFCSAVYLISMAQHSSLIEFKNLYWCGLFFFPFVFNYLGALIKDSGSAALVVMGIALYYTEVQRANQLPMFVRFLLHLIANILVFVAILIKPAALFMAIPLFFFSLLRIKHAPSLGFVMKMCFLAALATPILFTVSYGGLKTAVNAKESNVKNAIFVYDLTGMSHVDDENYLDGFIAPKNIARVPDCYDPLAWDNLVWGNCSFFLKDINARHLWKGDEIFNRWLYTVLNNPMAYAEHRLTHLIAVSKAKGKDLFYLHRQDGRLPWEPNKNKVMTRIADYYNGDKVSHIFLRPAIWLVISIVLLIWALKRLLREPEPNENALVACLAFSNLVFFLTLLFFGVAYDFRYFYTVIWQAVIAFGLLALGNHAIGKSRN